jgi:hypothetical protein
MSIVGLTQVPGHQIYELLRQTHNLAQYILLKLELF